MPIREEKLVHYAILLIAGILITQGLIFTKSILLPFIFSLFIYITFLPIVQKLEIKYKVPHALSILIGGVFVLLSVSSVLTLTFYSLANFAEDANKYRSQIADLLVRARVLSDFLGVDFNWSDLQSEIKSLPILDWIKNITGGFIVIIGNISLVTIFSMFLFLGGGRAQTKSQVLLEIEEKTSKYIVTKFTISLITALLVGFILLIFDVELLFLFVLLTFLLNFIPNVGSLIAILLPVPVLYLQFGFSFNFWCVLIMTSSVQMILGNVIEPKFMGESMDIHPICILIFLMFWGLVWGVQGMFLAVPISAVIKIVFAQFEITQPLARLMSAK